MNRETRSAGFTLLEVLVALAILGIALGGALALAVRSTADLGRLESRTWAHWVALNRIIAARLDAGAGSERAAAGVDDMGGRQWHWTLETSATADARVRRLRVAVRESAGGAVVLELAGYMPIAVGPPP